jgi:hypothetical protein
LAATPWGRLGAGFTSLELTISASNGFDKTYDFSTLASAEKYFTSDTLEIGPVAAGSQSIDKYYYLTASVGARGFGFNFNVDSPGAAAPEPSTWAMMLLGFAGLGFAALRHARKSRLALVSRSSWA